MANSIGSTYFVLSTVHCPINLQLYVSSAIYIRFCNFGSFQSQLIYRTLHFLISPTVEQLKSSLRRFVELIKILLTGCVEQHVFQANTNKNCICSLWLQRYINWNFPQLQCFQLLSIFINNCFTFCTLFRYAKLLSLKLRVLSSILNVDSFNLILKGRIN